VELMQGEILTMAPMGEPHALTTMQLNYGLVPHFHPGTGFHFRLQMPLALPALISEPEPDIAIVGLDAPTNEAGRPTSASLLIEVVESSLTYDREQKDPLYAAADIQEYWLVNLPERCLEVYRQPIPDASSFSGWCYQELQRRQEDDHVVPLAAPEVLVAVYALLPRR
jgi:Uma2 family endonuclease